MSLEWIESQRPRMIDLLQAWASINSGSYHVTGLAKQASAIVPLLRELGGEAKQVPLADHEVIGDSGQKESRALGQALLVRSPAREGPRVFLGIHFDTVYGPENGFQKPTWLDEKTLQGPGVCDAKGGLLVLLFALLAFERSPVASRLNWEILLNPDEELGSPGSAPLFEEAARRNDLALLFEPALADGALAGSRKGSGNFTFIVHGRSAHAGRNSEQGRNAIHALAALVNEIAAIKEQTPGVLINTGFIHGGGPVNVVPDRALCHLNVRVDSQTQQQAVEQRLSTLAQEIQSDGITIERHGRFHAPPKPLTPGVEWLLHQLADCGRQLGIPVAWKPTGGTCDGNRLAAAGVPTVDSLGVRGGDIHSDREFMHVESLTERARLVALFLMRLAGGEIKMDRQFAKPLVETTP